MSKDIRIIAFYLPQYYPTPTNDKWYGKGFTEWTNVGRAKPLFRGHYQPHVPADLGYYDLRYPEIRQSQALLAKEAGIEGFCYYHYWFGGGKQELELPLQEVIKTGEPDFPFCICWANQSWYSKFWNGNSDCAAKLIAEQKYDNDEGISKHFYTLLPAFRDKRHMTISGRLIFMIYRPLEYPDVRHFMEQWQKLAAQNGLREFYFIGQATSDSDVEQILSLGFDAVNIVRKDDFLKNWKYNNKFRFVLNKVWRFLGFAPYHYNYDKIYQYFIQGGGIEIKENIFPTLIPNWDHSPRSGKRGVVFTNSTPENFSKHLQQVLNVCEHKKNKIIFLKSWNEWGEGNYVEPDLKFGHGYLNVIKRAFNRISDKRNSCQKDEL